jgi:hypothetical protein
LNAFTRRAPWTISATISLEVRPCNAAGLNNGDSIEPKLFTNEIRTAFRSIRKS